MRGLFLLLFWSLTATAVPISTEIKTALGDGNNHFVYDFDTAATRLMPPGWEIGYASIDYRELKVAHVASRHLTPRWTEVLGDAARRYGLALLIDMEKERALLVPNDEFRTPGIHFVRVNVKQHRERFMWDQFDALATKEKALFEYKQEREIALLKEAAEKKVKAELAERKMLLTKTAIKNESERQAEHAQLIARQESQHAELVASLNRDKSILAEKSQQLETTRSRLEVQRQMYREAVVAATDAESLSKAEVIQLEKQREKLKAIEDGLKIEKAEYRKTIDVMYLDKVASLKADEEALSALKALYYPDVDRVMHAGQAETSIRDFLLEHWNYHLSFSDDLLAESQRRELKYDYQLFFAGDRLEKDVSLMVCSLTRDTPGLTIYSTIDPPSRLVVMQMHRSTEKVRKKVLNDCFK